MKSKSQILLTGVYRSGTEYFSNLLNLHPEVSSTMYRVNMFRFMYNQYNLKIPKNYIKLVDDFSERIFDRYKIDIDKHSLTKKIFLPEESQ